MRTCTSTVPVGTFPVAVRCRNFVWFCRCAGLMRLISARPSNPWAPEKKTVTLMVSVSLAKPPSHRKVVLDLSGVDGGLVLREGDLLRDVRSRMRAPGEEVVAALRRPRRMGIGEPTCGPVLHHG